MKNIVIIPVIIPSVQSNEAEKGTPTNSDHIACDYIACDYIALESIPFIHNTAGGSTLRSSIPMSHPLHAHIGGTSLSGLPLAAVL